MFGHCAKRVLSKGSRGYISKRPSRLLPTFLGRILIFQFRPEEHTLFELSGFNLHRVGHRRQFVHVAPKSDHLGPTNPWIPKFLNLNLGKHLRLGLEVL